MAKKTSAKKSSVSKSSSALARKMTSPAISSLASKILRGEKTATQADAKKLAASVLSQDEIHGQPKKK
jgi:hypothetical protein